jgi:hypothetical protein
VFDVKVSISFEKMKYCEDERYEPLTHSLDLWIELPKLGFGCFQKDLLGDIVGYPDG